MPTPVVALNRAMAIAETDDAAAELAGTESDRRFLMQRIEG